jgi:molecular chaperone DnaK
VRKSDVFSTSEANQNSVEIHVLQGERQMAGDNKSLGRFRLSGIPPAPRGVPQVQVSFDIDANGLLQVSATDRTTGRQQSVSIQGGSNLSEEEVQRLLAEAELKATEDRRKRSEIDRRNRAQTLVAQAERRLRDAALELGPYGADRQQRAVEQALRQVQDLLAAGDLAELEVAVSELQEALYGLNRRLTSERRSEAGGPLQGLKNTLGSLKDELFADDEWDDWDRGGSRRGLQDPWRDGLSRQGTWDQPSWGGNGALGGSGYGNSGYGPSRADARDRVEPRADWNQDRDQYRDRDRAFDRGADPVNEPFGNRPGDWSQERWDQRQADRPPARPFAPDPDRDLDPYAGEGGANPSYGPRRGGPSTARPRPPQDDPWAEV